MLVKILFLDADPAAFVTFRGLLRRASAWAGQPHVFSECAADVAAARIMLAIERYDLVVIRSDLGPDTLQFLLELMRSDHAQRAILLADRDSARLSPEMLGLLSGGRVRMLNRSGLGVVDLAAALYDEVPDPVMPVPAGVTIA